MLALVPLTLFPRFASVPGAAVADLAPVEAWPRVPGLGLTLYFRLDGLALLLARLNPALGGTPERHHRVTLAGAVS